MLKILKRVSVTKIQEICKDMFRNPLMVKI